MATMQPAGPLPELARIRAVCRSRTAGIPWTCSHCIPTLWYLWVLKEAAADSLTIPRMKKKNLCCFQKLAKFHESSDRMNFAATRTKRVDPSTASSMASILQKLETTWPWLEKREKGTLFKNERMRGDAMQVHPARPTLRFFCAMRDNSTL